MNNQNKGNDDAGGYGKDDKQGCVDHGLSSCLTFAKEFRANNVQKSVGGHVNAVPNMSETLPGLT